MKSESRLWWELKGDDLAKEVSSIGATLWEADSARRTEIEKNLRRFGGKTLRGLFISRDPSPDTDNIRLNITKAVTETLMAKVGSNRPRPRILTTGGDHALRMRAKKLQRFLDGTFKQAGIYKLTPLVFRDALLCGTGVTNFYAHCGKKQVVAERVFPAEILVDHLEGIDGTPQSMWRVKVIDRDKLAAMFPSKRKAIAGLAAVTEEDMPVDLGQDSDARSDRMVRVFEAWHLALFAEKGLIPGRRVMVAGDILLCDDEWEHDFFPFEFFHWSAPVRGFWGDSAVAEIRGLEKEVNTLLQKVQRGMALAGQPWILSPRIAKVKPGKLTNESGLIVEYDGMTPPTIQTFQPVHPQLIEQMWTLHAKAFEQLGTNEYQASATKPSGIESGRGLEQLSEEHLVRFKHVSQGFEDMVATSFSRQLVRCATQLDEELKATGTKEGFVVRAVANKTHIKLSWSECKLSPDDFFMETWPASVLPLTPSGKTEEVERWMQMGVVDPARARTLLDFPDLESETDVVTSDRELCEWQLEQMLDEGKQINPEPRQDLSWALQRGTFALEKAMQDGTPPAHLDLLRTFLNACDDYLTPPMPAPEMAAPGMAPPMAAPPMGPPGVPPAPPMPGMPA